VPLDISHHPGLKSLLPCLAFALLAFPPKYNCGVRPFCCGLALACGLTPQSVGYSCMQFIDTCMHKQDAFS